MYKFKEQFRDARISIPSLRLEVTKDNIDLHGELLIKKFPSYAGMIEPTEKIIKKIVEAKAAETKSSPAPKTED